MKNFNNLFSRMKTESISEESAGNPRLYRYSCATLARMWRYAAMMALLLTLACGQAWGTSYTWDFTTCEMLDVAGKSPTFTSTSGGKTLTYVGRSSDGWNTSPQYLKPYGATQRTSSYALSESYFILDAPSEAGTITINYAGTAGGVSMIRSANGVYHVNTATKSTGVTCPVIWGLTSGTTKIYIGFTAKCYINSITWTDVAYPTLSPLYSSDCCASMTSGASISVPGSGVGEQTGGSGWVADFSKYYKATSTNKNTTITFSPALTSLVSNGEDKGRIRVYYGSTGNHALNATNILGSLTINSGSSIGTYATMEKEKVHIAEYTIPVGTTEISSIGVNLAQNGSCLLHIEVLTHPAASSCSNETGLAYATGTVNKVYGDASFTNTLTNSNSLSVTYSSSNTNVATVNESTGAVTIAGAGTTTITATWAGNATYCADAVSYTLNVKPSVTVGPTAVERNYGYRYTIGETIDLTATAGGASSYSYQWQKYKAGVWTDLEDGEDDTDGGTFSGVDKARLQISECTTNNVGSYRCVVTGGEQTNDSHAGYFVYVYTLYGNYYNETPAHHAITWTSEYVGTVTLDLEESRTFMFKIYDNDQKEYGREANNFILEPWQQNCNTNNQNIRLFTGPAGDYIFTIDITNAQAETPVMNVKVDYPEVTHPASGYIYVTDWGWDPYVHFWDGSSNNLTADGSDPKITANTEICDDDYWYFPKLDNYINFLVKDNATESSATNKSGAQTTTDHSGMLLTNNGSWVWQNITKKITFDANGGTGSMDDVTHICSGDNKTLPTNTFTRSGWEFDGWNTNKYGTGTSYADQATVTSITSDITLYAQWKKVVYLQSSVSWWYNDNAWFAVYCFDNDADTNNKWVKMTRAEECSSPAVYKVTLPGNGFDKVIFCRMKAADTETLSWDNKDNQTANIAYPTTNDKFTISNGDNGQACNGSWGTYSAPTYTISYDKGSTTYTGENTISGSKDSETKTCGVDFTLPSSAVFTTTGYTQDGWATSDGGSKAHNLGGSYTTDAAATFYPHWAINTYTVTFASNNGDYGTVDVSEITGVPYGSAVDIDENVLTLKATDVTATATTSTAAYTYAFSGWSVSDGDEITSATEITATFTRTANSYTLAWDKNGGSTLTGDYTSGTTAYGTTLTPPDDPTRDGYTFAGWNSADDGTGDDYTGTMPAEDVTYYAQWEEIDYCYEYEIATSGSETGLYDLISGSGDGEMEVVGTNGSGSFGYNSYGIKFNNSKDIISIALPNKIKEGTQIEIKQYATGNGDARGLELQTSGGTKVTDIAWDPAASAEEKVITYTVGSGNALINANVFRLKRKTNTYLKSVKVSNCGSAATTYNVSHTLSHVSFSSGIDAGTGAALAGGNYTAIFEADDCYTLPSTITVTIGGDTKTVNTDYKWDSSTGKLVIWGAKVTGAIGVTITGVDNHEDPGLAYATDEVSKTVDDEAFTNTLTNNYGVTVSYESSDKDVATVDSDGEVTIVGAGTCTITASSDAQDCYTADDASYTLTVTSCTTPTVSWSTTPANGIVGGSMTAAVTTNYSDGLVYSVTGATPSGCVTIGSSTGAISYVKPGTATVKATVTGDGSTYCEGPAEVSQAITIHNPQVENGTYVYYYSDASHFDGTNTYNNPEGNTPSTGENIAFSQSAYTLPNSESIDGLSVVVNSGCYDNKGNHINSYIKLTGGTSTIVFTIETGYTATIKIKAGGYSGAQPYYMKLNNEGDAIAPTTGSMGGAATIEDNFTELVWSDLEAGSYTFKASTSGKNLYVSQIDIEMTSLGYTITKSASNGSISTKVDDSEVTFADENDEVTIIATPNTGYNFTSWSVTQTTGGTPVEVGSTTANPTTFTMPAAAVTVNATFTAIDYKITHHWAKNGSYYIQVGTGSLTEDNTTAHYGQTITLSTKTPSKTYKWGTWGVTMTESGEPVVMATDSTFLMPDGDVTIFPIYGRLYTVTFDGNGGRSVPSPITQANAGSAITMPAAPTSDSTFVGWVIGGTTYAVDASYTPTADVTAYAAWQEKCAGGGGGSTTIVLSWFYNSNASPSGNPKRPDDLTRYCSGYTNSAKTAAYTYTMTSSATQNLGTTENENEVYLAYNSGKFRIYADNTTTGGDAPATFTGVSAVAFRAKLYNKSSGTQTTTYKILVGTDTVASGSISGNKTDGYKNISASSFAGGAKNGYVEIITSSSGTGGNLYIDSIAITYGGSGGDCKYITYDGNGATGSGITNDATGYAADASVTVAANGFSYPGYTFTSWNTKANGSGSSITAGSSLTITQDTTLYAQWTPAELTLTGGADWTNPANWSPACVPTINHDVVINYNATLYGPYAEDDKGHGVAKSVKIKNGKTLNIWSEGSLIVAEGITAQHEADGAYEGTTKNDILIESSILGNGTLICGGASSNTAATYEFYTRTFRYGRYYINQYVGVPFTSLDAGQLDGFKIFVYADSTDSWVTPASSTLEAFVAYDYIRAYSGSGWNEFELNGTLNLPGTGDGKQKVLECGWRDKDADRWKGKTFPIPIDTIDGHQDFMFANSWTAPIDIASMEASDFDDVVNTIYIFNAGFIGDQDSIKVIGDLAGQWSSFPIASAAEMDNAVIPATQAFSVTATAANASLTLDYKKHVYDPAIGKGVNNFPTRAPRRTMDMDRPLKLRMKVLRGSDIADQLYVFEREDFTFDFDNGWDGNKAFGLETSPQLYMKQGTAKFSVGAIPDMDGTEVCFKAATDANLYTFSFEYPQEAEPLYLYDRETENYTLITNEEKYTFTTADKDDHARFVLVRSKSPQVTTGIENDGAKEEKIKVQKVLIQNHIYIIRGGHVYDVTGKRVQ